MKDFLRNVAILTLGCCLLSAAPSSQTAVKEFKDPENSQLKNAVSEIYKAINTGDEKQRTSYLKKARSLLEKVESTINYQAAIRCDGQDLWLSQDHCYLWKDICYVGNIRDAISLFELAGKKNLIGSDEEWLENPRLEDHKLMVTFVDGPNDFRDEWLIETCK